jgi:hypothetical protein
MNYDDESYDSYDEENDKHELAGEICKEVAKFFGLGVSVEDAGHMDQYIQCNLFSMYPRQDYNRKELDVVNPKVDRELIKHLKEKGYNLGDAFTNTIRLKVELST